MPLWAFFRVKSGAQRKFALRTLEVLGETATAVSLRTSLHTNDQNGFPSLAANTAICGNSLSIYSII